MLDDDWLDFSLAEAKICAADKLRYGWTDTALFVLHAKIEGEFFPLFAEPMRSQPSPRKRTLRDIFGRPR
jgi:hypothetical protein